MIDIHSEKLVRFHDARKLTWLKGRRGGRLDISTLRRWASRGIRGAILETVRLGGSVYTTEEAVERFVCALSTPGQIASQPDGRRLRELATANQQLDEAGII